MAKYLIEVPHDPDQRACLMAVEIFLKTGSHFLSHCDWGCMSGEHKAWLTVEVESKEEALRVVPPAFRPQARIIELNNFTMEMVEAARKQHGIE